MIISTLNGEIFKTANLFYKLYNNLFELDENNEIIYYDEQNYIW
jgi:hypothetical protein